MRLVGRLDGDYDPPSHILSLWLTPTSTANVALTPIGALRPGADNAWPSFLNVGSEVLTLGLASADNVAAKKARDLELTMGKREIEESLARGLTITLNVQTQQVDVLLQTLGHGTTPVRPFRSDQVWQSNERFMLMPGAWQVVGPFDAGTAALDVNVGANQTVLYRVDCAEDVQRWFSTVLQAKFPTLPNATHQVGVITGAPSATMGIALHPPACPSNNSFADKKWYVLFASTGQANVIERLRASLKTHLEAPP
jgi:hypothetical protein